MQQSDGELAPMILQAHERLAAGDRQGALEDARLAVERFPRVADSHRCLSSILTHNDLFRYDKRLCRALVEDGAIAEALKHARNAMRLADRDYQDFLQAGYCLTALGQYAEATAMISAATDMFCTETSPGLFAGMNDDWQHLLPHFLIVGVAKAGTTSLHHVLGKHPRVLYPVFKEVDYFVSPEPGLDWYLAHFPRRPTWEKRFIVGEACVSNFASASARKLIARTLPDVRLIALLRDPVDRAISHYYNDKRVGTELRGLDEAIDEELSFLERPDFFESDIIDDYMLTQRHYLLLGLYALHLTKWLKFFSPDQLLIVISEELNENPGRELARIFRHIGLKSQDPGEFENRFPGVYDDQQLDSARRRLAQFYARPNEQFFEMLGRQPNWRRSTVA